MSTELASAGHVQDLVAVSTSSPPVSAEPALPDTPPSATPMPKSKDWLRRPHVPGLNRYRRQLDEDMRYALDHIDCGEPADVRVSGRTSTKYYEIPEGYQPVRFDEDGEEITGYDPPVESPWGDE